MLLAFVIYFVTACASANHAPLSVVQNVDLNKYTGKWYEIARFDQKFQKNCTAVTANYSIRRNGTIKVVNTCRKFHPKGKIKKAVGRARVQDRSTNAKLSVQFFLKWLNLKFLSGKYWIIALGDNYEYAMVGDPTRKYLWILSRTSTLDGQTFNVLVDQAKFQGFDTSKLMMTKH